MNHSGDNVPQIKLIVGLGNPGGEYSGTRHNAGFMVVERFLAGMPAGRFEESFWAQSRLFSGKFRSRALYVQMPHTYMNSSGDAVGKLAGKLRLLPEEILTVVDDLDLPLGRLRLRCGGSDGGHNGLKSIASALASDRFNRLRIGIGRPVGKGADYVLGAFAPEEQGLLNEVLDRAVEALKTVLSSGMARAMNQFNAQVQPESEKLEPNQQ